MRNGTFDTWRRRAARTGQRQLADSTRMLVFRTNATWFDRLDFTDDAQFLRPVLFAHLTDPAPAIDLPQTLYGSIRPHARPDQITIRTDANGRAFLPGLGTVETTCRNDTLVLGRIDGRHHCTKNGHATNFCFRTPVRVPGTAIEITTDIDPLLHRFFVTADGREIDVQSASVGGYRIYHALLALELLRTHCRPVWEDIAAFVQLIVLFAAQEPNSFAALSAHGALFCNIRSHDTELALLEDIAHQGAHVIFNAIAHDPARLLKVRPDIPVEAIACESGDQRPVFAALHALFTYTLILRVLTAMRGSGAVSEVQSHELLGRIAVTLTKFAHDLRIMRRPETYTASGRRCYDAFAAEFEVTRRAYEGETAGLDLSGQPYVFDYACFLERNPGPWPALSEATA